MSNFDQHSFQQKLDNTVNANPEKRDKAFENVRDSFRHMSLEDRQLAVKEISNWNQHHGKDKITIAGDWQHGNTFTMTDTHENVQKLLGPS